MKKSLAAIAIWGAFASATSAQTNVDIYGIIDLALTREDKGTLEGHELRMDSGQLYGSRLGFRGTEDLGGGLSANFNFEAGINAETGAQSVAGVLFNRQSWLGIKGGFGNVRFGHMWSPYYTALFTLDPFGDGTVGGASFLMSGAGFRRSSAINYQTPNIGGFSGELAYSLGEVAGSTTDSRVIDLKGVYASGPITVAAAHFNQNNPSAIGGSNRSTLLGVIYDFNIFKAHLAHDWIKGDTTAGGVVLDTRDLLVGISAPVGKGTVHASYVRKFDERLANADARRVSIGYTYPMSKRTTVYAAYARTANDSAARYNIAAAAPTGAANSAMQVGLNHMF
jgi:predicted porin